MSESYAELDPLLPPGFVAHRTPDGWTFSQVSPTGSTVIRVWTLLPTLRIMVYAIDGRDPHRQAVPTSVFMDELMACVAFVQANR